jgi:hypothetical protein
VPGKHRLVAREVVCPGIAAADVARERHASHLAEELLRSAAAVWTGEPGATGAPSGHLEGEPIGSVCIDEHDALADLLAGPAVAEGAATAPVLVEAARAAGIEMPISEAVAALLAGASVGETISALLARPLKAE